MNTTQGLDMDMNAAVQWPGRVRLKFRVEHRRGRPEVWQLALDASAPFRAVTVFAGPGLAARGEGRQVLRQDLPGRTLRMRSQGMALRDAVARPIGPMSRGHLFREGPGQSARPAEAAPRPQAPV